MGYVCGYTAVFPPLSVGQIAEGVVIIGDAVLGCAMLGGAAAAARQAGGAYLRGEDVGEAARCGGLGGAANQMLIAGLQMALTMAEDARHPLSSQTGLRRLEKTLSWAQIVSAWAGDALSGVLLGVALGLREHPDMGRAVAQLVTASLCIEGLRGLVQLRDMVFGAGAGTSAGAQPSDP